MSNNFDVADAAVQHEIAPNALAIFQAAAGTNSDDRLPDTAHAINKLAIGVNEAIRGITARLFAPGWCPARESASTVVDAVVAVVDRQMRDNYVHNNGGLRDALIRDLVRLLGDRPTPNAHVVALDPLHPVSVIEDTVLATAPNNIRRSEHVRSGQPSTHILELRALQDGYDGAMQDEGN